MTELQKFQAFLREQGFKVAKVYSHYNRVPHHYKTDVGDHILISRVECSIFQGSDSKPNEVGVVCFNFGGIKRRYRCRQSHSAEILKGVKICNTADEAKAHYEAWKDEVGRELDSYQLVL